MDKLLSMVSGNITINWTGPWICPQPIYPARTAPMPPAIPAPIPPQLHLAELFLVFVAISAIMTVIVWWYGFRR